jgi:hypothetical protein
MEQYDQTRTYSNELEGNRMGEGIDLVVSFFPSMSLTHGVVDE